MGSCSAAVVDTVEGILVAGILVVGILVAGNPEEDILEERIAEEVLLQVALLDYNNSSFTKFYIQAQKKSSQSLSRWPSTLPLQYPQTDRSSNLTIRATRAKQRRTETGARNYSKQLAKNNQRIHVTDSPPRKTTQHKKNPNT